jgi:hypothetical protein
LTSTGVQAHTGIRFCTEYQRNGQIFRAHSDYRSDGAWYDWVMIKWARDKEITSNRFTGRGHDNNHVHYEDQEYEEDAADYAPGRICGFIQDAGSDLIKAIIRCCDIKYRQSSLFSTRWRLAYSDNARKQPIYELVDVDSIVRHVLMMPSQEKKGFYHEIWNRTRWADQFHRIEN